VSFAAACYVNGDYMQASEVVQDLFKTMTNPDASTKYEDSELHMFQNLCKEQAALELMTSGDDAGAQKLYLDAMAHLEKIKSKVVDLTSWRVKLAELTTKVGHFDAAITLWSALLAENSNNWGYHRGLQIAILRLPHDEVN
jgi:peptide alpha-N-acetyltransferase